MESTFNPRPHAIGYSGEFSTDPGSMQYALEHRPLFPERDAAERRCNVANYNRWRDAYDPCNGFISGEGIQCDFCYKPAKQSRKAAILHNEPARVMCNECAESLYQYNCRPVTYTHPKVKKIYEFLHQTDLMKDYAAVLEPNETVPHSRPKKILAMKDNSFFIWEACTPYYPKDDRGCHHRLCLNFHKVSDWAGKRRMFKLSFGALDHDGDYIALYIKCTFSKGSCPPWRKATEDDLEGIRIAPIEILSSKNNESTTITRIRRMS